MNRPFDKLSAARQYAVSIGPRNPWWIVAAMFATQTVGSGVLPYYALGILLNGISAEHGWGRAAMSESIALYMFCGAAASPVFGACIDRWGPQRPALVSTILFGSLLFAVSFINGSATLLALFAGLGLVSGGANGTSYIRALTERFDKRRGLALSIGAAGFGVGGMLLPLYSTHMLANHGWRAGFIGLAILVSTISLTSIWFGLKPRMVPAPLRQEIATHPRMQAAPWRDRSFWLIGGAVALSALGVGGGIVHAAPLMADRGIPAGQAAAILSAAGLATFGGRILGGYLMDLFFAPRVAAGLLLVGMCGGLLLAFGGPGIATVIGVLCFGFALGTEFDVIGYLLGRYCRIEDFGKAFGLLLLAYVLMTALSVYLLGMSYDMLGSYTVGFSCCAVLTALAMLAILQLGPYPHRGGAAEGEPADEQDAMKAI